MSVPQILNICNGRNWTGTDNFQLGGRHNSMCQITLFHIEGGTLPPRQFQQWHMKS